MIDIRWNKTATVAAVVVLCGIVAAVALPNVVYAERQPYATPQSARDTLDRAEHEVHAVRELLERSEIKEQPGVLRSLASKVSGLFGSEPSGDAASTATRAYERVKDSVLSPQQYEKTMHNLKVALGMEDRTTWEKIRRAFGADRYESVPDQLRHSFGYDTVTEGGFFQRIKHALLGEPESTLTKVQRALGYGAESSTSDWMHRVKVALGAEDPTIWENVKEAFEPSWKDKVMHPLTSNTQLVADHLLKRVKDNIASLDPRHQDTVMEKVKKAIGWQEPTAVDRVKDKYATGLQESVETGAHLTQEVASAGVDKAKEYLFGTTYDNAVHSIKVAVGVEDPTVWDTIKTAIEKPESIGDRVRNWIGVEGLTRQNLMDRITRGLSNLDPRKRQTTLEKVKKAIGWEEPSAYDKLGDTAQRASEVASEMLSGTSFDDVMHRVKVSLGAEDESVWETIQSALSSQQSVGDKVRHFLGRDRGISRSDLFERIKNSIPEMSRRSSMLTRIKQAVGLEEPGLMDKIRNQFAGGTAEDLLSSDSLQQLAHRAKVAIGAEDPSTWESIKSAFDFQPSLIDQVKTVFGGRSGTTREALYDRVVEGLKSMDPRRRDTILEKVKKSIGLQPPSLMDRVKETFGSAPRDLGSAAETAMDKANELLRGNTYDEAIHKIKVSLGQEDPTIWERVSTALHPEESFGEKVRHMFGRDSGISRSALLRRAEDALSSLDPRRRDSVTHKIKVALGMEEEPSLFGRAKDKMSHLFGREQEPSIGSSIDRAIESFRTSSENTRDDAYNNLRRVLEDARLDMRHGAQSLYDMIGGRPGAESALQRMENRVQSAYDTLSNTVSHWRDELKHFVETKGRGSSFLLESYKEGEGLSMHYVNDNDHEFLDVTGSKADERSFDKLKVLNSFRDDLNLPRHESLPENVSIQVHSTKRPHVLVRSKRYLDGNRFDYTYDDGHESIGVEWYDRSFADKSLDRELQHRMLREFRSQHGLALPSDHAPDRVRAGIRHFRSEL